MSEGSETAGTDRADAIVIGMGPGGEEVAGRLAEAGLDVVGIERELVGGECPYWGCVPSKMAVRAADLLAEARRIPGMAGSATVTPDWAPVARRIREEATDDWDDRVAVERFEGKGGRFLRGEGRIVAPGRVAVGDRELQATTAVVVATGARPVIPPIPGLEAVDHWTNREALATTELPASLLVLGGGAIALELAQAFSRFGTRVTIVEAAGSLLPTEEPEVGELLAGVLAAEGIEVCTGTSATHVEPSGDGIRVALDDGETVGAERLLVATGRRADPAAVGLDVLGVRADGGLLPVDGHLRVAPGVWALGDVTGIGGFTHLAVHQARIAAADILGQPHAEADYRALPRVTFSDPEVGSVGLTERAAGEAGLRVRTACASVPSSARGWIHKAGNAGLVKLVVDADQDLLVGATAVGPAGGEVLGMLALAVHARIPAEVLRTMIYAYPTHHRAVGDALGALDRS